MSRGIDYSLGQANVDKVTGIRYGVLPAHEVGSSWYDEAEGNYGEPTCPECESALVSSDDETVPEDHEGDKDYFCAKCTRTFWSDDFGVTSESPLGFHLDDGEVLAHQGGDDSDIFILRSPYFTRAAFCSPCAPGACYLLSPCEDGERAYCFGHEWFEAGKAPYPVYSVATGERVYPKGN